MGFFYRGYVLLGASCMLLGSPGAGLAQVSPAAAVNQTSLLTSRDPRLAANKRLVFDFYRTVLEAGHLEDIDKFLAVDYIQHNPNVPTGRAGFISFISRLGPPRSFGCKMRSPVINIVAERDIVTVSIVSTLDDPHKPGEKYLTTSFDMFRVRDGRIVEHWDNGTK